MKKLLMICLLAMIPSLAMADGPDGLTQSVTTSGVAVSLSSDYALPAQRMRVYVTCATSDITVSAWIHDQFGVEQYVKFTGNAWSDTLTIPAGVTVPIEGKFDFLYFDVAAGTHAVNMLIYVD